MRIKFILVISALMIFSGCALDKDVKRLERRMSHLEIENKSLQKKIMQLKTEIESQQAIENSLKDMYAGQGAEFYGVKEDVRHLNGRFDETEYKINQGIQELTDSLKNTAITVDHFSQTVSENKNRIQRIENFVGFEPGGDVAAKDKDAPPTKDKMSEDELYKVSKQAYDRADYETARQGFEKFLEIYPKSDKADNARFWIGEIYFTEGWYQKAILEYQEVIENYPKGNKIQSAYLKQGIAFHKLGENANALLVLKELIKKFPDANEARIARQKVSQIE
ncbi:MAG: tol-pal system protein YbgF [Desulfobacteraceae bacterium]|nr:tol-pal system protein YbgF [Desulfobacteraceae bacterium]MBC2754139.1 tol-pal system protein YbgF [Desulfobacteraceae bacterium]